MDQWELDKIKRDHEAEQKGQEVAKAVSALLNSGMGSVSKKAFLEQMQREHRTLQQLFTGLCVSWFKTVGADGYGYDGRNEASHKLGEKFVTVFGDDSYLPFI